MTTTPLHDVFSESVTATLFLIGEITGIEWVPDDDSKAVHRQQWHLFAPHLDRIVDLVVELARTASSLEELTHLKTPYDVVDLFELQFRKRGCPSALALRFRELAHSKLAP